MNKDAPIAYFINFSIQEIPSITYIARETGGIIYTDSETTYNFIKKDFPDLKVVYFTKIEKIRKDILKRNIKVIVYPDYHIRYFKDLPGVKHVQVFHGLSDKSYDYQKCVLDYDLFLIPGADAYERYKKRGLLKNNTGVMVGYPKLDRIFRGDLKKDVELAKLGLKTQNPTVLYAPTWHDKALNSSWKKFYKTIIWDKPEGLNLIVKLHPNITRYRKEEVEECRKKAENSCEIIILDLLPDIVPLMAASDLLLGDVSSVTREWLAFKRPFVFLSNKPKWMWKKSKIKLWECGEVVTKPEKLWNTVLRSLKNPENYIEKIEKYFRKTFYKPDGNAAKRAAREILNLIK